jgi:hypothetical protein
MGRPKCTCRGGDACRNDGTDSAVHAKGAEKKCSKEISIADDEALKARVAAGAVEPAVCRACGVAAHPAQGARVHMDVRRCGCVDTDICVLAMMCGLRIMVQRGVCLRGRPPAPAAAT